MMTRKTIDERIADLAALHALTETYEVLAAADIKKLRANIEEYRAFYDAIRTLFRNVHASYREDIAALKEGDADEAPGAHASRKEAALVLLMPNTHLNGEIVPEVFRAFREAVSREPAADLVVIGLVGKFLMERLLPDAAFEHVELPDERMVPEVFVREATRRLWRYRRVTMYHGVSERLLVVRAAASVVRGEEDAGQEYRVAPVVRRYLFEPSFETVVRFFETELFAALFEDRLREASLARFSSRLLLLDRSVAGIERAEAVASVERRRLLHRIAGKKQLGTVASVVFSGEPGGHASPAGHRHIHSWRHL